MIDIKFQKRKVNLSMGERHLSIAANERTLIKTARSIPCTTMTARTRTTQKTILNHIPRTCMGKNETTWTNTLVR